MRELRALLMGVTDAGIGEELARDGFALSQVDSPSDPVPAVDVILLELPGPRPLETYAVARSAAPDVPIVVLTQPDRDSDGQAAVRAGAEDHVSAADLAPGIVPRILRYAVAQHRMRRELRELEITDGLTGLPNLRGFLPVAEHHFRIADRDRQPVVLVFVQLDDLSEMREELGPIETDAVVSDAAQVIMDGVRDADYPARVADDTFCILLSGEAAGAEATVLSRLVESIAVRNARSDRLRMLSLSIGSAEYDPDRPVALGDMIETARTRMTDQRRSRGADPSA
ncbi:MAG: diguanylate cyclase [Actinobacteria bacterium]|nr:diguanylate cyclase [Actinomycetota bacterium]